MFTKQFNARTVFTAPLLETGTLTCGIWRTLYYSDGTASPCCGTTNSDGGTVIVGGGTTTLGGGIYLSLRCKFHNNIPNDCQDFANLLLGYFKLGHPVCSGRTCKDAPTRHIMCSRSHERQKHNSAMFSGVFWWFSTKYWCAGSIPESWWCCVWYFEWFEIECQFNCNVYSSILVACLHVMMWCLFDLFVLLHSVLYLFSVHGRNKLHITIVPTVTTELKPSCSKHFTTSSAV